MRLFFLYFIVFVGNSVLVRSEISITYFKDIDNTVPHGICMSCFYQFPNGDYIIVSSKGVHIYNGIELCPLPIQNPPKKFLVTSILPYKSDILIGTENGLYVYDIKKHTLKPFSKTENRHIRGLMCDAYNHLYIVAEKQTQIILNNGEVIEVSEITKNDSKNPTYFVSAVTDSSHVYMSSCYTLFRFVSTADTVYEEARHRYELDVPIKKICTHHNKLYFITAKDCGYIINTFEATMFHLDSLTNDQIKYVTDFCIDDSSRLWLTHNNGVFGASIVNVKRHKRESIFLTKPIANLPSGLCRYIGCDNENKIWIGTRMESSYIIQQEDDKIKKHVIVQEKDNAKFTNQYLKQLCASDSNTLWITNESGSIYKYETQNATTREIKTKIKNTPTFWLHNGSNPQMWLISKNIFCRYSNTYNALKYVSNTNEILPNTASVDAFNRTWGITQYGELCIQDSKGEKINKSFFNIDTTKNNEQSFIRTMRVRNDMVLFKEDGFTRICFTPEGKALKAFDVKFLHDENDLAMPLAINKIAAKSDSVWYVLLQSKYISKVVFHCSTTTAHLLNFQTEGIKEMYVSSNTLYLINNGIEAYAESNNTLNKVRSYVFDPDIQISTKNNVLIGNTFYLLNKTSIVEMDVTAKPQPSVCNPFYVSYINTRDSIILQNLSLQLAANGKRANLKFPSKYNNFTFHVGTSNYKFKSSNYYYALAKGGELIQPWKCENARNSAEIHYPFLRPGKYQFIVNTNKTLDNASVYSFQIKPHFLLSVPLLILYCLLIGCVIVYIERSKSNLANARFTFENKQTLYQNKLLIYANLSSSIKTPLTLIVSTLNQLMHSANSQHVITQLNFAQKHVSHIIDSINNLHGTFHVQKDDSALCTTTVNVAKLIHDCTVVYVDVFKGKCLYLKKEIGAMECFCKTNEFLFTHIIDKILQIALTYGKLNSEVSVKLTDSCTQNSTLKNSNRKTQDKNVACLFQFSTSDIRLDLVSKLLSNPQMKAPDTEKQCAQALSFLLTLTSTEELELTVSTKNDTIFFNLEFNAQLVSSKPKITTPQLASELPLNSNTSTPHSQILIVEDYNELQVLLSVGLSSLGQIRVVKNGREAMEVVKTNCPDIIITDLLMPVMNGKDLVTELKQNVQFNHIPIIVLSGKADISSKIEIANAGADLFVEKPFEINYLLSIVSNVLRNRWVLLNKMKSGQHGGMQLKTGKVEDCDQKFKESLLHEITKNMSNPDLKYNLLADNLGISKTVLYQKTRILYNCTPGEYIKTVRLEHAAKLLLTGNVTISEVCDTTGFSSISNFSNAFKKQYSKCPTAYIKEQTF